MALNEITRRRNYTKKRADELCQKLSRADEFLKGKACVYTTGSFGRLEASETSDLDLFIVGRTDSSSNDEVKVSQLRRLDEICVKAELIAATRDLNFPEFDGDGKYLAHYSQDDFIKSLGKPDDDSKNTLTGRLLLFLESRPLLGGDVYSNIIDEVVAAYWRDYKDHKHDFMPAFLANDILRLWRTFCVNYEARTNRQGDEKKAKGKVKNYKLKHSRMLTCYSALLYLLATHVQNDTVSVEDAKLMTKLTPTERLEWLHGQKEFSKSREKIKELLLKYEEFLENTSRGDEFLVNKFLDPNSGADLMKGSYDFGNLMFNVLNAVGDGNKFFRLIVV